jgi:hypothetical protein
MRMWTYNTDLNGKGKYIDGIKNGHLTITAFI